MEALVIGGTRNLGPAIVSSLLDARFDVTVFHRGQTLTELPPQVERVYGDRGDATQLLALTTGKSFDIAIDTTLYTGEDAKTAARLFDSKVGRYIVLSSGQVYLVRSGLQRPYRETDYDGPLMPAPPADHAFDYENWQYGIGKRAAEDELMRAHRERNFPVTILRLPMVNSERDHFDRILGYLIRLRDGGPILIPEGPHLRLRHVYGGDVVRAIVRLATNRLGIGEAYNLSQDEEVPIEEFLEMLAEFSGTRLRLTPVPKERLEAHNLIPDCSPFSDPWMSALDNRRSSEELGITYTPLVKYLSRLTEYFASQPRVALGYGRRALELELAARIEKANAN